MRRTEPDRPSASPRRAGTLIHLLLVTLAVPAFAQPSSIPFVVRATTTTGADVFPNPTSPSSTIRNTSVSLKGWYGAAAEIAVPFTQELSVVASVEYLRSVDEGMRPVSVGGSFETLPVRDGYVVVPVEVGVAVAIPISEETFRLSMSGGLGMTILSRIQEVAGARASTDGLPASFGLVVGVAFEVRIWPGVFGHLSTRFRDPEANVTSRFTEASTEYQGRTIPLSTDPSTTRLNLNGLSLSAGVMVDLRYFF